MGLRTKTWTLTEAGRDRKNIFQDAANEGVRIFLFPWGYSDKELFRPDEPANRSGRKIDAKLDSAWLPPRDYAILSL